MRHVTGCLIILGEDASVRVTNSGKVMVESGKGDPEHMIKDIKEQISSLKKEACKAKVKPVRVGSDQPPIGKDVHELQLMHLESGARGLGEALTKDFVCWKKEAQKTLINNLRCY